MMNTYRVVGLMSGSSLDGLDMALCTFALNASNEIVNWAIEAAETAPFPDDWALRLKQLPNAGALELAQAHADFGAWMGRQTRHFLQRHHLEADLVASHGHTVFHYPDRHFTFQLGDGAALAVNCGLPVVCDFRTSDIALGGQGAPLAPIADKLLFGSYDFCLNLGGIANISCHLGEKYVAFDICGANQALNALASLLGKPYDDQGKIAAAGRELSALSQLLDNETYFTEPYPKSLGNHWVQTHTVQNCLAFEGDVADKLHTVCLHIARQIAAHLRGLIDREGLEKDNFRMLVTGGGAYNNFLLDCIKMTCNEVITLEPVIPDPETVSYKEALLMALAGLLRLENKPNCLATVTGASRDAIGGAVYLP
ncbi:MAG: anhydro-N-acetylmuramic acid kinase [Saprospiraceae bacterium]|nr:anhydro-N-acetylmuramic acid kinase [Saprospiraceae bacterium]